MFTFINGKKNSSSTQSIEKADLLQKNISHEINTESTNIDYLREYEESIVLNPVLITNGSITCKRNESLITGINANISVIFNSSHGKIHCTDGKISVKSFEGGEIYLGGKSSFEKYRPNESELPDDPFWITTNNGVIEINGQVTIDMIGLEEGREYIKYNKTWEACISDDEKIDFYKINIKNRFLTGKEVVVKCNLGFNAIIKISNTGVVITKE